ncbi:hypothetical protein FJ420_21535 [Mesorhizobium sp. B3-1-3]|uniref:hypothetical protein n=1 Tax=unclassified Mesorhizobium TaxID=325217 RepID=UPI001126FDCC|nr:MULTISPECIES: hypothetical protein [unclassified Mesorhizobium]TPI59628.1 hypothetical protein FJ424_25310 [Mesorhizobium sp. B3-1-8]TPI67912.1 hypothetical protein FJ420_21535 [Mesorhizobium sp. B3-1-3]
MAYDAKALEFFIASPSDVGEERVAVREAIAGWNAVFSRDQKVVLMPVGWETLSPELAGRPQGMVNDRVLAHADIVIGIFWSRVGTATGEAVSGTIEEIERHHTAGKPVMLYFSDRPIPQDMIDGDQLEKLKVFKEWAKGKGLYYTYKTPEELGNKLRDHLPQTMRETPYVAGMLKGPEIVNLGFGRFTETPTLQAIIDLDAQRVLKNAATPDADGYVWISEYIGGTDIYAGKVNFTEDAGGREVARWRATIGRLVDDGLLEDLQGAGQRFRLTGKGWTVADTVPDDPIGKEL